MMYRSKLKFYFSLFCTILIFTSPIIFHTGTQFSTINLQNIAIVATHPFNWVEKNQKLFWESIIDQLHIEFLDRATGFMEGEHWYTPYVNTLTINYANKKGIFTGSYMILTPIPPRSVPIPTCKDPYGNTKPLVDICGGKDLNEKLIYHPDRLHLTISLSCPDWQQHFINSAKKILDHGLSAIDIDNIVVTPFAFGGDFSEWSVYNFRTYLKERFTLSELVEMGINDIENFDVRHYIKPRINLSQTNADILIIVSPNTAFYSDEIINIKSFVYNGGALLIQVESHTCDIVNELIKEFGILIKRGNILSSKYLWDKGSFNIYNINQNHEITKGLRSLTLNWGVALDINNPQAIILAETDDNTWLDINQNMQIDPDEQKGPFPIIVALEYGEGRIIIMGDRSQDSIFDSHKDFLRKALLWLCKASPLGKILLFDESHHEDATFSIERASLINKEHPEWFLYHDFKKLAIDLGLKIINTPVPPSFPNDKILREYVKFLHLELVNFIKKFVNEVKLYGYENGRYIPIYGNQWLGTIYDNNLLHDIALDSIILSPYLDLIQIEVVPPTFPPKNRLTLIYRIGHAIARNEKPVWQHGAFYENLGYNELDFNKVNITILGIAEAYANGAIKELDLAGWPGCYPIAGTVILPNMTVPKEIKSLIDFIWLNKNLLIGFKPFSKIALVYSIPSFLWNLFPALHVYPEKERMELIGIADMLQQLHLPYDVIIFGHPELFNDTFYISKLKAYDVLILPNVSHISHEQIEALLEYVKIGGKIIYTGSIPLYDCDHNPLTKEEQLLLENMLKNCSDRVIFINDMLGSNWYKNLMESYLNNNQYTYILNNFKNVLSKLHKKPLVIIPNVSELVEVNVLRKNDTIAIHLINYKYNLKTDSFDSLKNIEVLLDASIIGKPYNVIYLSPELKENLNYTYENGYLKVIIPSLNYWGVIVFTEESPKEIITTVTTTTISLLTITKMHTVTITKTVTIIQLETIVKTEETTKTIKIEIIPIWIYLLIGILVVASSIILLEMLYKLQKRKIISKFKK